MNRKIPLWMVLTVSFLVAAICVSATVAVSWSVFNRTVADVAERQAMYQDLSELDQIVRENYLFDMDEEALQDAIAKGYVSGIGDPYATYFTKEEHQDRDAKYEGSSYGVGISCVRDPDSQGLFVTLVHENSPAAQAGIQKGDIIQSVDGISASEAGASEILSLLQQGEGAACTLGLLRGEENLEFSVERKEYTSTTVTGSLIGQIGIIRIVNFASHTEEQFKSVYHQLSGQGMTSLVIDLRNNRGGTLDSTEKILDFLLPEGNLYTTVYKDGRKEEHPSDAHCVDLPMAVLVNGNSASASELFAGALRDFEAAKLVGTKTYGKGVMQNTYTLQDHSAVSLTFAYFNLPNGENYNEVGISPDVEVILTEEQTKYFHRLWDEDDPQLQAALALFQPAPETQE